MYTTPALTLSKSAIEYIFILVRHADTVCAFFSPMVLLFYVRKLTIRGELLRWSSSLKYLYIALALYSRSCCLIAILVR